MRLSCLRRGFLAGVLCSTEWMIYPGIGLAQQGIQFPRMFIPTHTALRTTQCPRDLTTLVDQMLQDLPSYINRVRTRAGIRTSYVVLAARPEFEPLPLSGVSTPVQSQKVQQVFFTTLMRRYDGDRMSYLQEYHWVFLTPSSKGWQLVMLYSTIGPYPARADQPPLPPRNSSDGSIAQSILDWLIECQ